MQKLIAILIVISFSGIALFGFGGMHLAKEAQGHESCAAAIFSGSECPYGNSPLSFVVFHIKAFKSFSTAIFGLILAAAAFFWLTSRASVLLQALNFVSQRIKRNGLFIFSLRKFIRRLSLYENSPSLSLGIKINP